MSSIRRFVKNQVVRWVDGDTVFLNVDMGFNIWSVQKFRLARINTPEKGQPGYNEANARVNQLAPVGSEIQIDCLGLDKYGRWLAEIYIPGPSSPATVNQMMLNENLAVPYK